MPKESPTLPISPAIDLTRRADGTLLLQQRAQLMPYPIRLTERLEHWADTNPSRVFVAQRGAGAGWQTITYAGMWANVQCLAQAMMNTSASPEHPVAILSGNDIDHATVALAAMHVGIPCAPISPAYSLVSHDFGKLRLVADQLTPGLVFANNGTLFERGLQAAFAGIETWVSRDPPAGRPSMMLHDLLTSTASPEIAAAAKRVTPDTIAKILFTSGSTGQPKGVINTHRMLCSNQAMIAQAYDFDLNEPPVLLDWLPWNHTFGGNHDFGLILHNGGTLYIDNGKPTPGAYAETIHNMRDVSPTHYFNVPKGFEALANALRDDAPLRTRFFSNLRLMSYAAANLAGHIWDELDQMALQVRGERIPIVTGFGSTETGPSALFSGQHVRAPGIVGLPMPGVTLKLVPREGKLEARLKSPSVTVGYWRQKELTEAAFDEEGFYRMGDALKFVDPAHPELGVKFDGRIAEDFKLDSGTWVSVGPLHARLTAALAPIAREIIIAGHDRAFLAVLLVPDLEACALLCADIPKTPNALLADARVRATIRRALANLATEGTGTSIFVRRALFLSEPLSSDVGEITDKGSVNQGIVIARHVKEIDMLYCEPPMAEVILAE